MNIHQALKEIEEVFDCDIDSEEKRDEIELILEDLIEDVRAKAQRDYDFDDSYPEENGGYGWRQ